LANHRPKTDKELREIVLEARHGLAIRASGSKSSLGHASRSGDILDLSGFSGVQAYEPEELILEAGPATPLEDIEKLVAQRGQMLAFEPPHLMHLLGCKTSGTLGGVLSCNLSGPRRLTAGAARDHVLGVSAVDGRGTIFKGGGRVVKNVTGYDMPKLIAGSYGTLAAMTSVVIKVLPRPETEVTLLLPARDSSRAVQLMAQAMATSFVVSSAAYGPDLGVCLRLEGIRSSVEARRNQLSEIFGQSVDVITDQASAAQWQSIREVDVNAVGNSAVVWRVSVAPGDAPLLLRKLEGSMDFTYFMDWAGGLLWIGTRDSVVDIRDHMKNGHAMLFKAPDEMKARIPVFHPQAPALAALAARVKFAFDPERKLNPGRMHKDY
jgi:glycolate oxidase FAD binding subunit